MTITATQAAELLERFATSADGEMGEALKMAVAQLRGRNPKDESMIARMAGNIAAGMVGDPDISESTIIDVSERLARGLLFKIRNPDASCKPLVRRGQHYQTGADSCSCGGLWPCDG